MNDKLTPGLLLLLLLAFFVGAGFGLAFVERWLQITDQGLRMHRFVFDWNYKMMAAICAVSMGVLGVALAGFRHLPVASEEDAEV